MAEGIKVLPKDQRDLAKRLGMKLDYDFNGEGYYTVSRAKLEQLGSHPQPVLPGCGRRWRLEAHLPYQRQGRQDTQGPATSGSRSASLPGACADPGVQYDDTINQWHTCAHSGRINALQTRA